MTLVLSHSDGQAIGIYYPSVPFAGQGVNFAINSVFATFGNLGLTFIIRNEISITENEYKTFIYRGSNFTVYKV